MPGVDEQRALAELANFLAKDGFFSKSFLWVALSQHLSPIAWWNGFCKSTELSKLAARFLELPATTAACERSFSTYAGIHTTKRNRLKNERASKIVYIAHNLKLLEKKLDLECKSFLEIPTTSVASTAASTSTSTTAGPSTSASISDWANVQKPKGKEKGCITFDDSSSDSDDSEAFSVRDSSSDNHWSEHVDDEDE